MYRENKGLVSRIAEKDAAATKWGEGLPLRGRAVRETSVP